MRRGIELPSQCSTPFGINGMDHDSPSGVLCRISLCSTPFGINGIDHAVHRLHPRPVRHVLNAFRHQRNGSPTPVRLDPHSRWSVLNAFRHQRKSITIILSVRDRLQYLVLNAFRHQRNRSLHSGPSSTLTVAMCSTPFGINGIDHCTFALSSVTSLIVLNAFRHHGIDHVLRRVCRRPAWDSAQRLSASTEAITFVDSCRPASHV